MFRKWLCIIFMLGLFISAYAHPHMFIDTRLEICFDGDRIDGLEITWYFDLMFTASILYDYDSNCNGSFSESEVYEIYQNAFSNSTDTCLDNS